MPLTQERIHHLLKVHISHEATISEENELMEWILASGEESELKNYVFEIWSQYRETDKLSYVNWDDIYLQVLNKSNISPQPIIKTLQWRKLAAAAAIISVLATAGYFFLQPQPKQLIAKNELSQYDVVAPSLSKAILTLADGTKIELDSRDSGTIAVQGNVRIIKKSDGEISYAGASAGQVSFNTLTVPRGSTPIKLALNDGSRIWLNVGSSLTYPTKFTGSKREVKITGEAYFEVVHDDSMPFVVQNGDLNIEDLGTHFNVNTYSDETAERVTLLEGSIRVNKNSASKLLIPGQEARVIKNSSISNIIIADDVDLDVVMAWKNGKFRFDESMDINGIMRQISRWYNVDIEYKGKVSERFWGSISKDVNVLQVLTILEATGNVKFKVDGNKITVMPPQH